LARTHDNRTLHTGVGLVGRSTAISECPAEGRKIRPNCTFARVGRDLLMVSLKCFPSEKPRPWIKLFEAPAVIRGAGNQADEAAAREIAAFEAVTKTQVAVTKTPTAMGTVTETQAVSSQKLKHAGGRPKLAVTKTQAERAATYRLRKRAAQ
jgi:hypothetical protein